MNIFGEDIERRRGTMCHRKRFDALWNWVGYSSSGDQELGEYDDEPVIIFKAGRLPPQFEEQGVTVYR